MEENQTPEYTHTRRDALHLLTRRDYSQHEITQKLKAKGHALSDIQSVTAELIQAGYLNDQRLIENYIHYRCNKGYGPVRISMELQTRGFQTEMIADQLDITDNAWFTSVRKVWQKYFKGLPSDFKSRGKQIRFLKYRGFTREQINSVLTEEDVAWSEVPEM